MSVLLQTIIDETRTISGLKNNQSWLDSDIAVAVSDAGSSLYDRFTETNQHYNVTPFDFTLTGGVGGNSVPLPDNFQQGHGLELNPTSARPITVPYLSNWLDRNNLTVTVTGPACAGREYAFSDGNLVVFPPSNSAGSYRLYYTPMWTPLALTSAPLLVETASIPVVPAGTFGFGVGNQFELDEGPPTFLATDVGCILHTSGAVNSDNNGNFPIASFLTAIDVIVTGTTTSETFPGGANVLLLRQSRVAADGTWTLYGDNAFTNTSIDVNVGDTLIVSGTQHNDGRYAITQAASGGNTILTADATGLVAENFNSAGISITVQPASTRPDLPAQMASWAEYLKVAASITIRDDREQPVASFQARLQRIEQRVMSILSSRKEEPSQPPLTRGHSSWLDGLDF